MLVCVCVTDFLNVISFIKMKNWVLLQRRSLKFSDKNGCLNKGKIIIELYKGKMKENVSLPFSLC